MLTVADIYELKQQYELDFVQLQRSMKGNNRTN